MAITKIHPITTTLTKALNYIQNPKKTDGTLLVDGYGCVPETAYQQFMRTKEKVDKKDGYLAFHLIQSFSPGEVDYETAHKIGIELADKVFKGRFQYVIATHIDRGNVHNHIIANSVSFKDFGKYNSSPNSYYFIRRTSDMLCKEYGLSVVAEPKDKGKSHYEHSLDKKGQSWKSLLRQNIDRCIIKARDWDEFLLLMQREKYEIKSGKYISFRAESQERFTRSKTLGADYTEEQIRNRIAGGKRIEIESSQRVSLIIDIENAMKERQKNPEAYRQWATVQNIRTMANTLNFLTEHNLLDYDKLSEKTEATRENYNSTRTRIKEIEKRLKTIDEDIHNIVNYRKTKPIADKLETVVFKERYRKEHEADLIIFGAAEMYLKKRFNGGKAPLIKDLKAEQKALLAEKDKLYESYYSEKSELSELQATMKNVDMILGRDKAQEQERSKKRTGELE
ncbi:MAG: relaxase/mobilization nuclease domain-containing protein [Ruminococcus sp.]|nr:relaxase/mobilization nuclease domain-containing protein [Ruminococcus sp.]